MKSDQLSDFINRAFELRGAMPKDESIRLTLCGSYPVKLVRDSLYLPSGRRAPGMIETFGGTAFSLICEDEGKQLLVPRGFGAEELEEGSSREVKVYDNGRVIIPGAGKFFDGAAGGVVVAGCGPFLEIGSAMVMEAEAVVEAEFVDRLFDDYGGLPTGTAA